MIQIAKIEPTQTARGQNSTFTFNVTVKDGDGDEKIVNMPAESLFDYRKFAVLVLERTGRLYGDGTYESWPGTIRGHLNTFWAGIKRDAQEVVPPPTPRQSVRPTLDTVLEPFPLDEVDWNAYDHTRDQAVS